jgi:hypothetical protein
MLPGNFQLPAGVLLVAIGLLAGFAGYRLFRAVLTIYGFLLGAFFASTLVAPSDTIAMLVALGVGGLLGALALYAGYFVGVGLAGAGLGATIAYSAWQQWRGSDPGTLIVLFFAAVGAALAVTLQRAIVIVATAFLGSQTVVAGVLALMARQAARRPGVEDVWIGHLGIPAFGRQWTFIAWVVLGIVGAVVQFGSGGPRKARARR